jgi:acyl-CoA dehydrogenase
MDFSDDTQELRELLERFFTDTVTSEYRRGRMQSLQATDAVFEEQVSELGLSEYFSQDSHRLQVVELCLLAYVCGKHLVPASIVEKILTQCLLPKISHEVSSLVSNAIVGVGFPRCCSLKSHGRKTPTLSGKISWATNCTDATAIVAMIDEASRSQVVVIPVKQKGVVATAHTSLDLTLNVHAIELEKASFTPLSESASSQFLNILACLKANEIAGACESVLSMTVDYAKTRKQFNRPVGSFQAVQQQIASAHVNFESIRSLSAFAGWTADNSVDQFDLTSLAAITAASKYGPQICETAIQCHGGIGFTWEYDLHLFLRRVRLLTSAFELSLQEARKMLSLARAI